MICNLKYINSVCHQILHSIACFISNIIVSQVGVDENDKLQDEDRKDGIDVEKISMFLEVQHSRRAKDSLDLFHQDSRGMSTLIEVLLNSILHK